MADPLAAPHNGTVTSIAAAAAIDGIELQRRERAVLAFVARQGPVTRHQIADGLGVPLSGVCGRVNSLMHDDRKLLHEPRDRHTGRKLTLPSPFGKPAKVVAITGRGLAWLKRYHPRNPQAENN